MQAAAIEQNATVTTIKNMIAEQMDSVAFTSWIAPLKFEVCDNVLVLSAQNQFSADYITGVYGALLKSIAGNFGLNLKLVVRGTNLSSSIFEYLPV